ncbi:MAG: phenylalanine--tRNA ligase subunit beta, partial [Traorella sp.]
MITSKKWLSQYMDLSDISVEELANRLTTAGLEVEGLHPMAVGTNLTIGEIVECVDHPDSDHLHVCQVDLGDSCEQIVCGAPNCRKGLKVIVAKPGAVLPDGTIKNGKIRGVESNGMICSLLELGVDSKSLTDYQKNGIEELGSDAVVGGDPLAYLGLDDTLIDVGLTPNRSDCMASFALAKEVGAILHKEVCLPKYEGASDIGEPTQLKVSSTTEKCPLFLGKVIKEVTIKPSPKWIQETLHAAGIKAINNVVDISNLVMLETGQPTHFYDINKMHQDIVVSTGFDCIYTALDGVDYKIEPEDIMITTHGNPVGIAGLMGGDDSKIDESTKGIIIEVATFNYVQCRNTARRLNITSDASVRNAKEIEPGAPKKAMDRCVQLLLEYADAKGIEETAVYGDCEAKNRELCVSKERINKRLGTNYTSEEMCDVLRWLDFSPVCEGDQISLSIPSYRADIKIEADVSEEIIRLIGFDTLKATLPEMEMTQGKLDKRQQMTRTIRTLLTGMGAYESETYTLVGQKEVDDAVLGLLPVVELASPMSEERKYVRNS